MTAPVQHPPWCDVAGRCTVTLDPSGGEHRSAPVAAVARRGVRVSTSLISSVRDGRIFFEVYVSQPVVALTPEEARRLRIDLANWLDYLGNGGRHQRNSDDG